MGRRKRVQYEGVLAEPLPTRGWNVAEIGERVIALLDHYGIDNRADDKGWDLAMALAMDHVPGLQCRKKPGAPATKTVDDACLVIEIIKGRRAGKSINATVRHLTKSGRFKGCSPDTLRDRYYLLLKSDSSERARLKALVDHAVENQ